MENRLSKVQTLIIAVTAIFLFGFSAVNPYSEITAGLATQGELADQSDADASIHGVDCDSADQPCNYQQAQTPHASDCCPLTRQLHFRGRASAPDMSWRMANNLAETSSGPHWRPPRLVA